MNKVKNIFFAIYIIVLCACSNVAGEVSFKPYAIPLRVSVNTWGEISITAEASIDIPTPLGVASAGVIIDPSGHFEVPNSLTVRLNGMDHFFDLKGNDFEVQFDSAFYSKIELSKNGENLLLVLEKIPDDEAQVFVQELTQTALANNPTITQTFTPSPTITETITPSPTMTIVPSATPIPTSTVFTLSIGRASFLGCGWKMLIANFNYGEEVTIRYSVLSGDVSSVQFEFFKPGSVFDFYDFTMRGQQSYTYSFITYDVGRYRLDFENCSTQQAAEVQVIIDKGVWSLQ